MKNFFNQNLLVFNSRFYSSVTLKNHIPPSVERIQTRSGNQTAKYGSILLHSSYDPVKEAKTIAKNLQEGQRVCLYGYGLGYHVESILNKIGPNGLLFVIELNPDILGTAMILRNQTQLLSDPRLQIITGSVETEVAAAISKITRSVENESEYPSWKVIFHSPSFKCIPEQFSHIANALEILLLERKVSGVFKILEKRNLQFNLKIISQSTGLKSLAGKFRNRPAILISAGPSLDDVVPFLDRFPENALLTCVDTAYPILWNRKTIPDFVFTLDPQDESLEWFNDSLDNPVPLIFTPTSNAKLLANHCGPKYVVFKDGSISSEMKILSKQKGTTQAGGSVSCLGLDGLIQMGCNPIFLVGQDCAFPAGRTYSRFSKVEAKFLKSIGPQNTLSQIHRDQSIQKKKIKIKSFGDGQVISDQVLYSYLRNLDELAQANPEVKIFNLNSHGGFLKHIQHVFSINEALQIMGTFPEKIRQ